MSRMNSRSWLPIAAATAVLGLVGCGASTYMKGMEPAKHPPIAPQASYTVTACVDLATNQQITTPPFSYYLEEIGPTRSLYEFDARMRGAKITNAWIEGDSDIFFGYVRLINFGFKWVLPRDRSQPGQRFVYKIGQFQAVEENGVMKVEGNPIAECAMAPGPSNPATTPAGGGYYVVAAPAAAGPATAGPPPGRCTSDTECPGEEICDGGTCTQRVETPPPPVDVQGGGAPCRSDKECPGDSLCESGHCTGAAAPSGGCMKDTDCKGDRICVKGTCTAPAPHHAASSR